MEPAASCHGYQFIDSRAVCAAFTLALGSEAGSRDPEMKRHRVNCRIRSIHSSGDPDEQAHPVVNGIQSSWRSLFFTGSLVVRGLEHG
jgi:hypothetical protein